MLQIFIHGTKEQGFLDLMPGASLDMEAISEIFDTELGAGEYSLPIEIPLTPHNRRLIDFADRMRNFTTEKNYWVCDVLDNGFPELIRAKITMLDKSANLAGTKGKMSASVSGNKGLFGSNLKGKKLRQVDLGGTITWDAGETREFATDLMKGLYPQYHYLKFATVAIESFFDTNKNYNGEFLAKDTVNYVVGNSAGGPLNWEFGRPSIANEQLPTLPGDEAHIDSRSIPFFNFKYVLMQAFAAVGYIPTGEFINSTWWNDLHIFNTTALEYYSPIVYQDYNRKIFPADHVPDIELVDFFKAVFDFFNIFPIFDGNGYADLRYRTNILFEKKVLDITHRCSPDFTSTYKESGENTGYKLDYTWDAADGYPGDRIKDLATKTLVATVATLPNLGTLSIGRPLTTDDIAYVAAENMYYVVANAVSIPILWDAWSEGLDPYSTGDEARTVETGISTLCTYVEFDIDAALFVRKNRLAARQTGTYYTNKLARVVNPFALRLFYITKQLVDGLEVPMSHNHNLNTAGSAIQQHSLALKGPAGLAVGFHEKWQALQDRQQDFKIPVLADAALMQDLKTHNILQINNIQYLLNKRESTIPLKSSILLEMQPL